MFKTRSKTSEEIRRRKQLAVGDYSVPEGSICDYGCGNPAHFILMGNDKKERFCCSRRYLSCPAKRFVGAISRYKNILGQTFNYLTVIKFLRGGESAKWLCRCSCGKEVGVTAAELTRGGTKSCGHIFYHGKSKTIEYVLYHAAKARARQRKLPFTINLSDIIIPNICPILGIPIQHHKGRLKGDSPSIDRIYPTKGYVTGNIAVISHTANRMKGENTPEALINLGEKFQRLYENIGNKLPVLEQV